MTPNHLVDQLAAELAIVALGLALGGLTGLALFCTQQRRERRAQWPH